MTWRDWLLLCLTVLLVTMALYIVFILPAFAVAGSALR